MSNEYICTADDVKSRLAITSTEHDTVITKIIKGVASKFNTHTRRELIMPAAAVTEYFTGQSRYLKVRRYPIISVTTIKEACDYDFTNADALVVNDDYRLVNTGRNGIILRVAVPWLDIEDAIQIVYQGGYCAAGVTPSAGQLAMPDDLIEAAIQQASFIFKRKDDIGLSSTSFQGGSVNVFANMKLLPLVEETLEDYIRRAL